MIQRIQSIFLVIVVLCGIGLALVFANPFTEIMNITSFQELFGIICAVLNYCSIILALFCLFKYKNRRLQMQLCLLIALLNIVFLVGLLQVGIIVPSLLGLTSLPFIAIVATFLARRSIKKDEQLVRSADRIR